MSFKNQTDFIYVIVKLKMDCHNNETGIFSLI